MITQKPFDVTAQGEQVTEYTLTNESGASVTIIDFGGIVTGIKVPDRDGKLDDVALGYDNVATYQGPKCGSMGMLIGRVGNRIAKATFDLEGKTYPLGANNGVNNLHGGPVGFGLRMWEAEPAEIDGDPALIMRIVSEDGDQGFPGKVEVQVTSCISVCAVIYFLRSKSFMNCVGCLCYVGKEFIALFFADIYDLTYMILVSNDTSARMALLFEKNQLAYF